MSDPNDLQAFYDLAWQHLARGAADSRHPARFPTFATVSPSGMPEARTVAMRRASVSAREVEVHTDVDTPKVASLRHAPFAALHVWVPRADLQIRLTTKVEIVTGPAVDAAWASVPVASRVSYGTNPLPGTPIDHVHAYEKPTLRARFAVLLCAVTEMDIVQLGARHRRAFFGADTDWHGTWVAP
ncbi:pyridoxamine 5'-phosphate oxidase family protein [uncultured Tateyamaria sp.]|uniref:pyridoxamine 5'-phosphate oxidase family protein n=1 Tax=uncultured Tateyamaria sp. TaxID=455651 RepID=UPI002602C686|nr:pyridoxamine 5'-phosphate oxidase family protein [uncultured Tateyamaria sp.]